MQDTIQTDPDILLRTHTSVQVRYMETTNHLYVRFLRKGFFVMKPFHLVHIVFFIKWKDCISTKMFRLLIKNNFLLYKEMFGKSKSVYVLLIFRLRNQVLR
jgi:hypothetical protein